MTDAAKENWIQHYIFFAGSKWDDPRPTREEAERAWSERHSTPKPATPEAPEWKIAPPPRALLDLADMELKARQEVCGITDLMRGVSSPEDRALSDFIARRKAKREALKAVVVETFDWYGAAGATDGDDLSRALSTPLPHDPPMSVRLMPWRGKE